MLRCVTGVRRFARAILFSLLVSSVSTHAFASELEPTTTSPRGSHSAADVELSLTKGILLYEQADYGEALAHLSSVAESNEVAAQYVELCQQQLEQGPIHPAAFYDSDCDSLDCDSITCDSVGCDSVGCDSIGCDSLGCDSGSICGSRSCAPRPWHLTFLTGYQYDSNVTLEPEFVGLGSGRGIEDSSWLMAAFGDYQLVQRDRWNVGAIGSLYGNQYFEANDFDSHDFMGGSYANFLLTNWMMAGIRYEYHETLLDYDRFASQHRLVPNVTMLQGAFGHLTTYYEFEGQDFHFTPLIPAQARSGNTNSFGFTQALYTFGGDGRIYGGYRYDRAQTDGTDFDRKTHMATGRVEIPLCDRVIMDGEYRHFWDDYDNPNSLDANGRPREDRRSEVRAGMQFICNQHVSFRTDYTYIDSNSNTANLFGVRFFDYDRHIFSTQFIYDF